MRIAVLGTGEVGSALGTRLASAGHHVVHGSRTRAGEAGTLSPREAVASSDVVVTAVLGTAVLGALKIGDDVLAERIVLDPSAAFTPQMTMAYPGDSVAQHHHGRPTGVTVPGDRLCQWRRQRGQDRGHWELRRELTPGCWTRGYATLGSVADVGSRLVS
jgi:hypothetical protein